MGTICVTPVTKQQQQRQEALRRRRRSRMPTTVSPGMERVEAGGGRGELENYYRQMSIGHVTKINTLVMVGPQNEANFNGADMLQMQSLATLNNFRKDSLFRAKITLELSMRQHALIEQCWREQIAKRHPDIFHRTMLNVIEASPKVNEVIACQRYCYRDLTKWPKLNRICQAQFCFYERLILTLNLNEQKVLAECTQLGQTHAQYAQYGLKPHFLDIFQHQFLALLERLDMPNESEKREMIVAFSILTTFILDVMNHAYSLKMSELRHAERNGVEIGGTTTTTTTAITPNTNIWSSEKPMK